MTPEAKSFWSFSTILFGGIFFAMVLAIVIWPAEMKCATSYYVAPQNTSEACAQFTDKKEEG